MSAFLKWDVPGTARDSLQESETHLRVPYPGSHTFCGLSPPFSLAPGIEQLFYLCSSQPPGNPTVPRQLPGLRTTGSGSAECGPLEQHWATLRDTSGR